MKRLPYLCIGILLMQGCTWYKDKFHGNTKKCAKAIFIPTGSSDQKALELIVGSGCLLDTAGFLAYTKGKTGIQPGRYKLPEKGSNEEIWRIFSLGKQEAWNLTFHRIDDMKDLAGVVCKKLEPDSAAFAKAFQDSSLLAAHGFPTDLRVLPAYFIPNTYEFYWNTSPAEFLLRMKKEYELFWNDERRNKAEALGLEPEEVSILASIVQREQAQWEEEWPTIAGLYLNRLKLNMRLQADPTVKFALGKPTLQRVLNHHLEVNHAYNTYLHAGLPPGPICIPLRQALDAVLNAEDHDYLYMCAKADMSGKHAFAKDLATHSKNAKAFHREMNRKGIR